MTYIDSLGKTSVDEKKVNLIIYSLDRANNLLHWFLALRRPADSYLWKALCEAIGLKLPETTALPQQALLLERTL